MVDEQKYKENLTPEQYAVLRQGATEPAYSGKYYKNTEDGMYHCGACNAQLFSSDAKYDSGSGWPSFDSPTTTQHVKLLEDTSHGMHRTEVRCAACDSHLGHVFDDGPRKTTGKRYCINSLALNFQKHEG